MLSQWYGRKAIWLYAAAGIHLECTDPLQPCSLCPGDYFSVTLSIWIPHTQVLLLTWSPLFLPAYNPPQVCFPWSLCYGPTDMGTVCSRPPPVPRLLFSLHIHVPSLTPVSTSSTCLHAAYWQWLIYTLRASVLLLHQNPDSLYMRTCLAIFTFVSPHP